MMRKNEAKYLNWIREDLGIEVGQIFDSQIDIPFLGVRKESRPSDVFMFLGLHRGGCWFLNFLSLKTGRKRLVEVKYNLGDIDTIEICDEYDEDNDCGKIELEFFKNGIPLSDGTSLKKEKWKAKLYRLGGYIRTEGTVTRRGLNFVKQEYRDILDRNALFKTMRRETEHYRKVIVQDEY